MGILCRVKIVEFGIKIDERENAKQRLERPSEELERQSEELGMQSEELGSQQRGLMLCRTKSKGLALSASPFMFLAGAPGIEPGNAGIKIRQKRLKAAIKLNSYNIIRARHHCNYLIFNVIISEGLF